MMNPMEQMPMQGGPQGQGPMQGDGGTGGMQLTPELLAMLMSLLKSGQLGSGGPGGEGPMDPRLMQALMQIRGGGGGQQMPPMGPGM